MRQGKAYCCMCAFSAADTVWVDNVVMILMCGIELDYR